jgi:hypothetical protein
MCRVELSQYDRVTQAIKGGFAYGLGDGFLRGSCDGTGRHTPGAKARFFIWFEMSGVKRVLKKSIWGDWREGPGLKPLVFCWLFRRASAVQTHDILYRLFRDILYTFCLPGGGKWGWLLRGSGGERDGVEDDGGQGAEGAVRCGRQPGRLEHDGVVRGVRHLATNRVSVAGAVSCGRRGWSQRTEPPTAFESGAHGRGGRAADRGVAWRTARLGSAQTGGVARA